MRSVLSVVPLPAGHVFKPWKIVLLWQAKVIACGGGIIETDRAMDIMRSHHPAAWAWNLRP